MRAAQGRGNEDTQGRGNQDTHGGMRTLRGEKGMKALPT